MRILLEELNEVVRTKTSCFLQKAFHEAHLSQYQDLCFLDFSLSAKAYRIGQSGYQQD